MAKSLYSHMTYRTHAEDLRLYFYLAPLIYSIQDGHALGLAKLKLIIRRKQFQAIPK